MTTTAHTKTCYFVTGPGGTSRFGHTACEIRVREVRTVSYGTIDRKVAQFFGPTAEHVTAVAMEYALREYGAVGDDPLAARCAS